MIAYLDSSLVLRHVINGEKTIVQAIAAGPLVSSELLRIECRRAMFRHRLEQRLGDAELEELQNRLEAVFAATRLFALTRKVKRRAEEAFPVHVKTLDALHLATCIVLQDREPDETILLFSHDATMNRAARLLGFSTPLSAPPGREDLRPITGT